MLPQISCSIDWPTTLKSVKELLLAASGVIATGLAVYGVNAWRRQQIAQSDADLSVRLSKTVFRLRNNLGDARRPSYTYEIPNGLNLDDDKGRFEAFEHIINARWSPVSTSATELEILSSEAEAHWDSDIVPKIKKLLDCCHELYGAMSFALRMAKERSDGPPQTINSPEYEKEQNDKLIDITQYYDDESRSRHPNTLTVKILDAVADITTYVNSKRLRKK